MLSETSCFIFLKKKLSKYAQTHISFVFYSMYKYVYFLHNCLKYVCSIKLSKIYCCVIFNSHLTLYTFPYYIPIYQTIWCFFLWTPTYLNNFSFDWPIWCGWEISLWMWQKLQVEGKIDVASEERVWQTTFFHLPLVHIQIKLPL